MRWYDDYLRWLYRGGRPNFFARLQNRALERAPGARPHIPIDRRAAPEAFERIAPGIPVFRITTEPSARA
jgi:hypothetical protein